MGLDLAVAVAVGVSVVPVGAEVGEPGFGVGEEVPDDDEDRSSDGAPGPGAAEAAGQAADPFAEEGVGAGGAGGGLGAVALQVAVALALLRLAAAGAGLAGGGARVQTLPGRPTVRRAESRWREQDAQEANAGGRKAAGYLGRSRPLRRAPWDNWPDTSRGGRGAPPRHALAAAHAGDPGDGGRHAGRPDRRCPRPPVGGPVPPPREARSARAGTRNRATQRQRPAPVGSPQPEPARVKFSGQRDRRPGEKAIGEDVLMRQRDTKRQMPLSLRCSCRLDRTSSGTACL